VARADEDERVVGEPADGLVDRGAAQPGDRQEVLDRQEAARPQLAVDDQVLDPLVGELGEAGVVVAARRRGREGR